MKCGIYLYSGSDTEFSGVNKKIEAQIRAFSNCFEIKKIIILKQRTNLLRSIVWRLPFGSWGARYREALEEVAEYAQKNEIAFFYIRAQLIDRRYLGFLIDLRKKYENAKIILEIPTYPYAQELLKNKTMWPWFFKELAYRRKVKKLVDRIVTFSSDDKIWGIPTIKTMNGMNVGDIGIAGVGNSDDKVIRMIAVAMMQPYHGFERIIKGLATYYSKHDTRNIELLMVGYGSELEYYKSLVEQNNLSDRVIFKGKLQGEELDRVYDGCDLAIGSMAGYKIGIEMFSSIKLGEYLAKGLPIVTGARTLIFDKYGDDYNLDFPNDASEIDIEKVLEFYNKIYKGKDKGNVRKEIHEFALRTIDVNVVMKDIIDYLES